MRTLILALLVGCSGVPTTADIYSARARVAQLVDCRTDAEPRVHFLRSGAICVSQAGDGIAVGCQRGDDIDVLFSDHGQAVYVLEHELVHWCLWRTTGDGDGRHTLPVWSKFQ